MQINTTPRALSALPVACAPVAHEFLVGRLAAQTRPAPLATRALGVGTSVPTGSKIADQDARMAYIQFVGEVRGVPPRGRPV